MLYHLGRDHFRARGAIIDCGAFLGKSAALLAQGVRDNQRIGHVPRAPVIHSFDWFRVCDAHDVGFVGGVTGRRVRVGESTRALFEQQTAEWSDLIRVHEGTFLEASWPGGEIEILFIDICKSPALNAHVVNEMFPALVPLSSVVVQQDYHHAHHPAIHLSLEALAAYIEPLATRIDDSFVFRLRDSIPSADLTVAASVHQLPPQRQMELMAAALARLPENERHFVELARVVLIRQLYGRESGMVALSSLPERTPDADRAKWEHELSEVRRRVAE